MKMAWKTKLKRLIVAVAPSDFLTDQLIAEDVAKPAPKTFQHAFLSVLLDRRLLHDPPQEQCGGQEREGV